VLVTCPSNSNHKRFLVSVKVMETWLVDENGNYQRHIASLTVEKLSREVWTCAECGAPCAIDGDWAPRVPPGRPTAS
jgi:ribosomal protein L37AE/L43A